MTLYVGLSLSVRFRGDDFTVRFNKAVCNSSGISTTSHFCYVKAYSRTLTTLNIGYNLTRNLDNFFVKHRLEYKYGTIYRTVMNPAAINWCSLMNKTTENLFFKVTMEIVEKSIPELIHTCPYNGEIKALNMSLDPEKFGAVYPQGEYRNFWRVFDDKDSNIYSVTFITTMQSPIKSSFG
ncbi:unnamed protein product [Diamesa hyperborea]